MAVAPMMMAEQQRRQNGAAQAGGDWVEFAAAGALLAGGVLILAGQRKAGMVAGAAGAALCMADQQGTLKKWWEALPGTISQVQRLLGQVEATIDDVAARRESLVRALGR